MMDAANVGAGNRPGTSNDLRDQAARRLQQAQNERRPCPPVRDLLPKHDLAAAYAVQSEIIAERIAAGARVIGRKIGLTNPKVQTQLGVDQPDFGVLLDDMACPLDQPVDVTRLLQPKIEAEIAFILAADLDQPVVTEEDVIFATDYVVAALEIVDSRIAAWDISIVDTIADNGSSGLFTLGATKTTLTTDDPATRLETPVGTGVLDLSLVTMTMTRGGLPVSDGTGADCLGNPVTAVAWLANTARDYGSPLRAGDIVLSGALGPMVPVIPGSTFTARISGVGEVSVQFTDTPPCSDQASVTTSTRSGGTT